MLITINCPSCHREISNVESDWAGQKTTCGLCGNTITVPTSVKPESAKPDLLSKVPDVLPFDGEPLNLSDGQAKRISDDKVNVPALMAVIVFSLIFAGIVFGSMYYQSSQTQKRSDEFWEDYRHRQVLDEALKKDREERRKEQLRTGLR